MATPTTDIYRLLAVFNGTREELEEILRIARRMGLTIKVGVGGTTSAGTPVWRDFRPGDDMRRISYKVEDVRKRTVKARMVVSIMKRVKFGRSRVWRVDRQVKAEL